MVVGCIVNSSNRLQTFAPRVILFTFGAVTKKNASHNFIHKDGSQANVLVKPLTSFTSQTTCDGVDVGVIESLQISHPSRFHKRYYIVVCRRAIFKTCRDDLFDDS
jgi:hypothetical protein